MPETPNKDVHESAYYRSLTRNMVITVLVVSMMPLILISGALRYYFNVYYQDKSIEHLKVLIKKHKQNIDNFLNLKLTELRVLSRSFPFEQLLDEVFLKEALQVLQDEYGKSFVDLGIVDNRGIQVAYAGPFRLKEVDYSKADWFKKAMEQENFISDVFPGMRGLPHFIVTTRVNYRGSDWVLRATVDFEAFNALVESIRIGNTGFAFILNKKGEFQTKPRYEILASKGPYRDLIAGDKIRVDEITFLEMTNDYGTETIYVMAPLKNGDWVLAYQQDSADAYAVIQSARWFSIIISLLGLAAIVFASILMARRMVKKIAEADRQKEMMNEQVIEAGKLASLGELAAGIAHEINNPVAIMVEEAGWMEDLLKEETTIQESENLGEFKRALDQIRVQGRRCKEITHKLLSFARKTDPTVKNVNLNELIEDVVALSEQRAKFSGVKIRLLLNDDIPTVNVSPSEIQQVILNLINNSLDAMEKTGGNVDISTRINGSFVVVDVADNGPGIAKANLQRIFDPFFTTKPVGKGTGLGLSICYGIIKKMGGDITVNSAAGMGTTFHVHIPWVVDGKSSGQPPASA